VKRSTFIILCLGGGVLSFNVAAAAALVPAIAKEFALSQFLVGSIIWFYMLPYGIAALLYGPLIRVFDAKRVELVCLFLFSCANLLAGLSKDIATLFIARALMGAFGASVIPLGIILIAEHIDQKKRGRYIGGFFSATFTSSLLGVFLSGVLNWRLIFLIPCAAGFLLWLTILFVLPSFKPQKAAFAFNYAVAFRRKDVLFIFSYIFFISLFYHGIQQWLGVYFSNEFHLGQFAISMLITLTSLSGIFGEAFGGVLADTLGRLKTINTGILLMIGGIFSLMFKLPLGFLALLMVIWGFGWTFNHAGVSTLLTDLPKEFLHEAASLNSGVRFISGGLGVACAGFLMQKSFVLGFTALGAGLVVLLFLARPMVKTIE
jgi:predicted MFS family arabinose efflux permease